MRTSLALIMVAASLAACVSDAGEATEATGADALVGGERDLRWKASGYLARGTSMATLDLTKPLCGATLIAPNRAVTAAHCVTDADATYAFGVGDVGKGEIIRVVERHLHPDFHPEAEGVFDVTHVLRNYDVAYLVLERAPFDVIPAELPTREASMGLHVQAIGYHAPSRGAPSVRKSVNAYVMFQVDLGNDPVIEVHPAENSALCIEDGDDGSPVVLRDVWRTVLVGIFVGSITSGLTDCKRGTQFVNGYESAYGYREFLLEGLPQSARRTQ